MTAINLPALAAQLADLQARRAGLEELERAIKAEIRAAVIGRPAPPPTELGPKGGHRLSARLTEWLMGWPDGWVTDTPGITRTEALRCSGNGVVPQQAAEALMRWLTVAGAAR